MFRGMLLWLFLGFQTKVKSEIVSWNICNITWLGYYLLPPAGRRGICGEATRAHGQVGWQDYLILVIPANIRRTNATVTI